MEIGGMTSKLRESLIFHDFSNFSQLASQATKLEEFIREGKNIEELKLPKDKQ